MSTYNSGDLVIRVEDIPSTQLQGETVLLSLEHQRYFGLRKTSQRIWQLLEQPCTLTQICDHLTREYEVESQTCEREVEAFLRNLWEAHLIRLADRANR